MSDTSLRVRSLQARLGSFTLGPIDLEVPSGAYVGVVGPSGQGKSALLWALAGVGPATGMVLLGDQDWSLRPPQARSVGLAPQDALLFPHLTVAANIGYAMAGARTSRVADLARTFGVEPLLQRRTAQLSGGEAMRVAVARAVGRDPKLLLLDEPLAAIDEAARAGLRATLRALRGSRTILHVTHDLDEAAALATHLCVLREGRCAAFGTVEQVLLAPPTPEVAAFLGLENVLAGRFTATGEDASRFTTGGRTLHVLGKAEGTGYVTIPERAVMLALSDAEGLSARNAIPVTVAAITFDRLGARVSLQGELSLFARLERESVAALGLAVGFKVFAIVKAAQVRVMASGG